MTNDELRITDVSAPAIIKPRDASDGWSKPSWSNHSTQVAIDFSTNLDLWSFAKSEEYNVAVDVTACADGKLDRARDLQSSVHIYTKSGQLDSLSNTRPQDMGLYRVYFSVTSFSTASDTANTFRYDFASNPLDVCFRLAGGNMLGGRFYSNTVVISAVAIQKALLGGPQ
jgi:hypothetical protein